MTAAIIVAGGRSSRMGKGADKMFLKLGHLPLIGHTLMKFQDCPAVDLIYLVVRADTRASFEELVRELKASKVRQVVDGGAERQDSVTNGLMVLPADTDVVLIHDGARPCVTGEVIERTIASARQFGSGVAAHKIADTIKEIGPDKRVLATVPREKLWAMQTPQTFRYELIKRAYSEVKAKGAHVTDDAAAVELMGEPVYIVESVPTNLKVTTPPDVEIARVLLTAKIAAE